MKTQALDAITLKHLAAALDGWLAGAKVSKVQHPAKDEFQITFWGGSQRPGAMNQLYINLSPEFAFCALLDTKQKQDFIRPVFTKPTSFCMLLRKHLGGANVLRVETLPGERVLNVVFENFNELGNKVRLVLSLELMGKHSNMVLYDDVQELILGVAHGVSERMSQYRELSAGLSYAPPPEPIGKRHLASTPMEAFTAILGDTLKGAWAETVIKHFYGFGKLLCKDAVARATGLSDFYALLLGLEAGEALEPALKKDGSRFTLLAPPGESDWQPIESVHTLAATYFTARLRQARLQALRQTLLTAIHRQEKKRAKRAGELEPVPEAEIIRLQDDGDRLLAALSAHDVPPKPVAASVKLPTYDGAETLTIAVDPSLGWVENAQVYYRRAKKARARQQAFDGMNAQLEAERQFHEELALLVEQADSLTELAALEEDLKTAGLLKSQEPLGKKKPEKSAEQAGLAEFRSSDGLTMLVGKSSQANGLLVGKLARPEDWWLHVHQMPGSHVLVRAEGDTLPDATLLEGATLAVHYSSARASLNVPVIYTQSRYVRKIPGSYPGHVNYRNEKTVFITPDTDILARLSQPVPPQG